MDDWLKIENVDKAFKIAAIIIGGIWVYFNYLKARTYKPRLEPTISGKVFEKGGTAYLVIVAKLKNSGLSKIELKQEGSAVRILAYNPGQKTSVELVENKWLATFPIFPDDEWVEPGKGIEDQLLVAIPNQENMLFRVELRAVASGIECKAVAVTEQLTEKESSDEAKDLRATK